MLPPGGSCSEVFDPEVMMGPLSKRERENMNDHRTVNQVNHWRVRLAIRVCDHCPMSTIVACRNKNPTTPGIRGGIYIPKSRKPYVRPKWSPQDEV
jgi:hypothetical protein